jgi:hypothetical protein
MMDHNAVLIAAAEAYMLAVKRLGEESGYNRLTYFEAPILKMPTEDMREEAHERWLELNISGQQLSAAVTAAKRMLNEPQEVGMRELLEEAVSFANQVAFMDEVRNSPEMAAIARRYEAKFKEALASSQVTRPQCPSESSPGASTPAQRPRE